MGAPALLERLCRQGFRFTAEGDQLRIAPKARLTDALRELIRRHKPEILAALNQAAEARRRIVLGLLARHPDARYGILVTEAEREPEMMLLTLAIRDEATCEFRIPAAKCDPTLLIDLIERHADTRH